MTRECPTCRPSNAAYHHIVVLKLSSVLNNVCVDFIYITLPVSFVIGIMVRDEAARDRLQAQIGDIGLIMLVTSAAR